MGRAPAAIAVLYNQPTNPFLERKPKSSTSAHPSAFLPRI